jgi:hypothetical protein
MSLLAYPKSGVEKMFSFCQRKKRTRANQIKNSSTQKSTNSKTHQHKTLNYYFFFYKTAQIFAPF